MRTILAIENACKPWFDKLDKWPVSDSWRGHYWVTSADTRAQTNCTSVSSSSCWDIFDSRHDLVGYLGSTCSRLCRHDNQVHSPWEVCHILGRKSSHTKACSVAFFEKNANYWFYCIVFCSTNDEDRGRGGHVEGSVEAKLHGESKLFDIDERISWVQQRYLTYDRW